MLVLTRKCGERILIQGGIAITIVRVNGGKVAVGVDAPDDRRILREELIHDQEERDKMEAVPNA